MELRDPFGICFNLMKLKYETYDTTLMETEKLKPNDSVNVFINMETILNYLSTIKDLEQKLILYPDFKVNMIADFINVAAHYKEFFISNGLDTKVFLYMTDLDSSEGKFHECKFNMDYRCYYLNKYNGNPKFGLLVDSLKKDIFPRLKIISEFIPNVYFINANNIEGSLVPYIIGDEYADRKNMIISADAYETQYGFMSNYVHHMYRRFFGNSSLCYTPKQYIKNITKRDDLTKDELEVFSRPGFYNLLLSCIGDRFRSIDGINGIGSKTLWKIIVQNINEGKIFYDTSNIDQLSEMFEDSTKDYVKENMNSLSLKKSYGLLLDGEKKQILSQITDRLDVDGLKKINQTMFHSKEHELRLESLLK